MTHYDISYKDLPRVHADAKAIEDMREYLTTKQWAAITTLAWQVESGREKFGAMNFAFMIVGVSGYPFHAFCREYCLSAYIRYMRADPDPVQVDDQGFPVAEAGA